MDTPNNDTIALLGLDAEGRLVGGCSTSGWGYKLPGRVGDSPIIGSGLFVDGGVGAASTNEGFEYAVTYPVYSGVLTGVGLSAGGYTQPGNSCPLIRG